MTLLKLLDVRIVYIEVEWIALCPIAVIVVNSTLGKQITIFAVMVKGEQNDP